MIIAKVKQLREIPKTNGYIFLYKCTNSNE